jgi:hypothetical protein
MPKIWLSILFTLIVTIARSQNLVTALRLNQIREFRTVQPQRLEETEISYTADGKTIEKRLKVLDDAGMLYTEDRFDKNNNPTAKITFTNDPARKLVLKRVFEQFDQPGSSKEVNIYNYDTDNALINVLSQDEKGKVKQRCDIINNKKGQPVELNLYNVFGNAAQQETAIYLYDKNTVITTTRSADGKMLSADTVKISLKNAHQFADKDYIYNEKGDPIKWIATNPDGLKTIFEEEYKYDKMGNCTYDDLYATVISPDGSRNKKEQWEIKRKYTYEPAKKSASK